MEVLTCQTIDAAASDDERSRSAAATADSMYPSRHLEPRTGIIARPVCGVVTSTTPPATERRSAAR